MSGGVAVDSNPLVEAVSDAGQSGTVTDSRQEGVGTLVGALPISLVECPICLQLLCEPLTTPCGHTFCRPCLVGTLRKNKKKCPTCRAVCHTEPETQKENITLAAIIKNAFPSEYANRIPELERDKEAWSTELPIFYYNDTLFPFSPLSLHLFEERYKVMIRRIVEASRKFCYLPNFVSYQVRLSAHRSLKRAWSNSCTLSARDVFR